MTDAASKALKAYEEKHNKKPKDGQALVAFVKSSKELKPITLEQAKAALSSAESAKQTPKGDKTKAPKNGNAKESAKKEADDEEEPKPKPKETKKEVALYQVGDQVLMSKDRVGVVRHVGEIAELGPGLWYGVELVDGSIGQTDGSVHGKRYFTTEGKRALFVQSAKIRRKMKSTDYKKHDSLRLTQPNKEATSSEENSEIAKDVDSTDEKEQSGAREKDIVPAETAKPQSSQKAAQGPAEDSDDVNDIAKSVDDSESKVEQPRHSNSSQHLRRRSSTLAANVAGVSGAEAYETLLAFMLRQSDELKEQFLDIYSNPKLNPILVSSYSELKHMEKEEQERVWNALLTRWKRFA